MLPDIVEIILGNFPFDTGFMSRNGAEFFEDSEKITVIYNTTAVPYIVYNEEGTIYTTKNKGFITVRAEGKLNEYLTSQLLGLHYNKNKNNKTILERQHKLYVELGAVIDV